MPNLYRKESCDAKYDAQRNLSDRTHYVDDDTLRFHKSRILDTFITDGGLLFALIESYAADFEGRTRLFRPVIFDVFGNIVSRPDLEDGYGSSKKAISAMWDILNELSAVEITENAIAQFQDQCNREIQHLLDDVHNLVKDNKAA